jgi:hypothetical protein
MKQITPQEYCELTGKTYQLVQRYLADVIRLKQFDTDHSNRKLSSHLKWLGAEDVEQFGRFYLITIKND